MIEKPSCQSTVLVHSLIYEPLPRYELPRCTVLSTLAPTEAFPLVFGASLLSLLS